MKPSEAKHLALSVCQRATGRHAGGLITPAHRGELERFFEPFDRRQATAAVDQYHRQHAGLDLQALYAFVGTPAAKAAAEDKPSQTWCDIYRAQNPSLRGRSDLEVVLRVHRGWFYASRQTDSESDRFRRLCQHALIQNADVDSEDAEAWANTIIENPEDFARVLDDLRANESRPAAVSHAQF